MVGTRRRSLIFWHARGVRGPGRLCAGALGRQAEQSNDRHVLPCTDRTLEGTIEPIRSSELTPPIAV